MKNIKIIFISIIGLLSLVFTGYVVRQNLETRRGAAGGGDVNLPSSLEICSGSSETLPITVSADQLITSYVLTFSFDSSKIEVDNVSGDFGNWSIKDGNLVISSHTFRNPKENFPINVSLNGKSIGSSSLRLIDSFMSGVDDGPMSVNISGSTSLEVIDCSGPVNTNTPTEVPSDGGEITIDQPGSLQICQGETETISISGDSNESMVGLELYFDYDQSRSSIEDVIFDSNWDRDGGGDVLGNQLFVSSFYTSSNPPKSFQVQVELKGTEPGRFNFALDQGKSLVSSSVGQEIGINYTGGTSVFVQDCTGPTSTLPPQATDTPMPTNTSVPGATNTPEPTPTEEPSGCKPCPDGSYVDSVADYDCDGTVNMEDFAAWYDDYKAGSDLLYGDFNCNGELDQGDVTQWYQELPKF